MCLSLADGEQDEKDGVVGKLSSATITRLAANPLPTIPTNTVTHVASTRGH
jgi:hypothetical protein